MKGSEALLYASPPQHRLHLVVNEPLVANLKQRAKWTMKVLTPFPAKLFTGGSQRVKKKTS